MPSLRIINRSCRVLAVCTLLAPVALEAQFPRRPLETNLDDTPVAWAGRFNGDGDWNLAVANLGSITLLRVGNGGLNNSSPALPTLPPGFFLRSITTGDFAGGHEQDPGSGGRLAGAPSCCSDTRTNPSRPASKAPWVVSSDFPS